MNIQQLTVRFAVSSQITPDDVATIAAEGYRAIVCNRPDGEEPEQPTADAIAAACEAHGLEFGYLPFQGSLLPPGLVEAFADKLNAADGPVLAYCRSGQRCGYLYMNAHSLLADRD